MEDTHQLTEIPETELQQLRQALRQELADGTFVLGAQLGDLVRGYLTKSNLRRFGGLKAFVGRYCSDDLRWHNRRGMDDVYLTTFSGIHPTDVLSGKWRSVLAEPTLWLWPAVSNPSIDLQFAWSPQERSLMHAPARTIPAEGMILVAKITKTDYGEIANMFVQSGNTTERDAYLSAIASSDSLRDFVALLRQKGRLAEWEVFRIDHVLRLFAERIEAAGATKDLAAEWADRLRSSQQYSRSARAKKTPPTTLAEEAAQRSSPNDTARRLPEERTVAAKAIEFLSDREVAELRLPLGSIMSALRCLFNAD